MIQRTSTPVTVEGSASRPGPILAVPTRDSCSGGGAGLDPDDLWHLATAISSQADVILTCNIRDFERTEAPNSLHAVDVVRPDDFFEQLVVDGLGTDLTATIRRMSSRLARPHRAPPEILAGLEHIGLTKTVGRLRQV